MPNSAHFLGNCLIEFDSDDVAWVETYFQAILELDATSEGHLKMLPGDSSGDVAGRISVDVLGRYVDRFEKRNDEWRVARRITVFDAAHARLNVGSVDGNHEWALGTRDAQDPVFRRDGKRCDA